MKPEPGRVQGVRAWANDEPYTAIVCTRGHKKRTIDRMQWSEWASHGQLYTAGWRMGDLPDDGAPSDHRIDPGTSAEDNPVTDDTKWRLRCPCGLNVTLSMGSLDKMAKGLRDLGVARVELSALAAIVS